MGLFSISADPASGMSTQVMTLKSGLSKSKDLEKDFSALHKILNSFLEKDFGVHYKFTYEDLKFDIKEKNPPPEVMELVERICNRMTDFEFDKSRIDLPGMEQLCSDIILLSGNIAPSKKEEIKPEKKPLFGLFGKKEDKDASRTMPKDVNLIEINPMSDEMFAPIGPILAQADEPAMLDLGLKTTAADLDTKKAKTVKKESISIKEDTPQIDNIPLPAISIGSPSNENISPKYAVVKNTENKETKAKVSHPTISSVIKSNDAPAVLPVASGIKETAHLPAFETHTVKGVRSEPAKPEKDLDHLPSFSEDKETAPLTGKASPIPGIPTPPAPHLMQQDNTDSRNREGKKGAYELSDLVKKLERNKQGLKEEIKLIENEQSVLKKERTVAKKKDSSMSQAFQKKLDEELFELEEQRQDLIQKERDAEDKLSRIRSMEKELDHKTKTVKDEEEKVNERKSYIETKEKVITVIKKDLEAVYDKAMNEIDRLKVELKDKEHNFMELQDYFNRRENRLHLEETNLMDEKRKHGKLVSSLLINHLELVERDLSDIEDIMSGFLIKESRLNSELAELDQKFKLLVKEKNQLKYEASSKDKYFKQVEIELGEKDEEFKTMAEDLTKREGKAVAKLQKLIEYESTLEKSEDTIREKIRKTEEKELDHQILEREISRLHFSMKSNLNRLRVKESQIEKRISSFEAIRQDIKRGISREKAAITRIENRLRKKGVNVSRGIRETEKLEKFYDIEAHHMFEKAHKLKAGEEIHIKELRYLDGSSNIGNPSVLDILRLINIAKLSIRAGEEAKSKDAYDQIQKLFGDLDEFDREELYPEVTKVFKAKNMVAESHAEHKEPENIDTLMREFEESVEVGDVRSSGEIYSQIQSMYIYLSKEDKGKYYPKIRELYGRIRPASGSM